MTADEDDLKVLSELSHSLWKNKALYTRALELCEKSLVNPSYVRFLNEILKEIQENNKKMLEKKIKEQQR
ncbi:MAG: hypothetical protein ACRC4T_10650 [Cetobacterium sp.]